MGVGKTKSDQVGSACKTGVDDANAMGEVVMTHCPIDRIHHKQWTRRFMRWEEGEKGEGDSCSGVTRGGEETTGWLTERKARTGLFFVGLQ